MTHSMCQVYLVVRYIHVIAFLYLKVFFVFAESVDHDKMQHHAAFHLSIHYLGVHYLTTYMFRSFTYTMD